MSALTPQRWIAWVRVGAVAFAALEIGVFTESFPEGYEVWAWGITAAFALIALLVFLAIRAGWSQPAIGAASLVADTVVIGAYGILFSYEYGSPTRWGLMAPCNMP